MPKSIVLTFDDGMLSQYSIARPILNSFGLTATFFICGAFIEHPYMKNIFMKWEHVKDLSKDGFEVGSHLYHHFGMIDKNIDHLQNIQKMENKLGELGIPKPVSLSYPGYHVDKDALKIVRLAGYRFARAGCEKTSNFMDFQCGGAGSPYNYLYDNPFNINCAGIFGKKFGVKEFKQSLENIKEHEIPVYCFHSFEGNGIEHAPETDISKEDFLECMKYIFEGPFQTIKMCDIDS